MEEKNDDEAELMIYGVVGEDKYWSDVTSKQFAKDLKALGKRAQLTVKLNSPGGNVFTGVAIYNQLKQNSARITAVVEGLAASAASVIAMAGDDIVMLPGSIMVIHNPWTFAAGDHNDLRDEADKLEKIRDAVLPIYTERTGLDAKELQQMLDDETYMVAEEAVDLGFADRVGGYAIKASMANDKLIVNGIEFDSTVLGQDAVFYMLEHSVMSGNKTKTPQIQQEDEEEMEITKDTLMTKHPDVYNAVLDAGKADGVKAERARLQALNELDDPTNPEISELVNKARFETGETAEQIALQVCKLHQAAAAAQKPAADLVADAGILASLTQIAPADEAKAQASKDEKELEYVQSLMKAAINTKRGKRNG